MALPLAAVIGASRPSPAERDFQAACRRAGAALPVDALRLATGACGGYPDDYAGSFHARGGFVRGYSPGSDLADHTGRWNSPALGYSELCFGFGGLLERQIAMLRAADFVIALGGNVGTLSELCMAVKLERPILAVSDLPGMSSRFPALLSELSVYPNAPPPVEEVPLEKLCDRVLAFARRAAA
jgi:predicted Rossmann-fold nucleotide-binding protein